MKKHIFWIVPSVLLIFAAILSTQANYFNRFWFNVRHVIYFGLVVYTLLVSLYFVYRFFILRYADKRVIKISIVFLVATLGTVGTVTASNIQLHYIEKYEVPYIDECTYYDQFGNVIYKSLIEACPTLHVMNAEYPSASFTVQETYKGEVREAYNDGESFGFLSYNADVTLHTAINIEYIGTYVSSIEYIYHHTYEKKPIDDIDGEIIGVEGDMYYFKMENDFSVEDRLTTTYTTKEHTVISDTKEISYPDFDELEPTIKTLTALKTQDDTSERTFYISYERTTITEENEEVTEEFANARYYTLNESLLTIDFPQSEYDNGATTDYSFDINDLLIKSTVERLQVSGIERRYEERTVSFESNPVGLYSKLQDDSIIQSDVYFMTNFTANLDTSFSTLDYTKHYNLTTITNDIFVYDQENYTKLVPTEYGLRAESYKNNEFNIYEIIRGIEETTEYVHRGLLKELDSKGILKLYTYDEIMRAPGGLSGVHFYQHNHLVEFVFIDDYEAIGDKN